MTVRTYIVKGVEMKVPAYVHRTADGWKITMGGFSRNFSDQGHGSAALSLHAANSLLDKIIKGDKKTLFELYPVHLAINEGVSKGPNRAATAFLMGANRHMLPVTLAASKAVPAIFDGSIHSMKSAFVREYFSPQTQEEVFAYWCDELRRSMKMDWKREISAYLRKLLAPTQLELLVD